MDSRFLTKEELEELLNKANDDGLQEGAQVSDEAYREGFLNGYAAAVEDHERGEFIDPSTHLQAVS